MARQIFYRLEFDSVPTVGQKKWQLDLIADDAVVTIPDFTGTPLKLIGDGNAPITIEHIRRDNPYEAILGSSANINLYVTDTTTYRDFNSDGRFVWECRLRYFDSTNTEVLYWCGYIQPEDGSENVTSVPFPVSFTAVDGLGVLGNQLYPVGSDRPITTESNISLVSLISDSLEQTGLDLDLYIDSGITSGSGVALISATTTQYSFTNETLSDRKNLKEILDGILQSFNCKVYQADGRWYVVNNSVYGGSTDSVAFEVYNHLGVKQANQTLNVRQTIGGNNSTLLVKDADLMFTPRPPVGSVQANVQAATAINYVHNGNFEDITPFGWSENGPDNFQFSETSLNGRSVTTNRSVDDTTSPWFQSTTGVAVDYNFPSKIEFDYFIERLSGTAAFGATVTVIPFVVLPTPITGAKLTSNSLGLLAPLFGQSPIERTEFSTNILQWHQKDKRWSPIDGSGISTHEFYRNTVELDTIQGWSEGSIDIGPLSDRVSIFDGYSQIPEGGILRLQFMLPQSLDSEDDGFNSTNSIRTNIDNVGVRNVFTNDETSPVFELVQPTEIDTINYEPLFYSWDDSTDGLYQKLSVSDYWEKADGTSGDARALEQIVCQQKLNDYRNQFKYYEGTLITTGDKPLSQADKILIDYDGYTEVTSAICNGGVFNPKQNTYDIGMYVPDQSSDAAAVFHTENVDLIAAPAPDRANSLGVIQFNITAHDISNAVIVDEDGDPIEVTTTPKRYIALDGQPGQIVEDVILIDNPVGYAPASAIITNEDDIPSWVTVKGDFRSINGQLQVPVEFIVPRNPEFVNIDITAIYSEFSAEDTPGVVNSTVTVTNSGTNLAGSTATTYDVSGIPGSTVHFTHHIKPVDANYQLFAGNFDATYSDNSLTNQDAVSGIDSVAIDFAYSIPTTGESVAVTVSGNATPAGIVGVDLQEVLVNFNSTDSGFTFHEDSNTFTGVPGATLDYFITVIPDSDQYVTNVPPLTLPANVSANGDPFRAGENWEIPIHVTIPALTDPYVVVERDVDISVTTKKEPYSLIFNINNVGVDMAIVSPVSQTITFDDDDFGDSIAPFTVNVIPKPGTNMLFDSSGDIQVDVDEAAVFKADGSIVSLPEEQFTASPGTPVSGSIPIVIAGNFPSTGGEYTLNINVSGEPVAMPATSGQFANDTLLVPQTSGTYGTSVTANGSYTVRLIGDTTGITLTGATGTDTGKVTFDLTASAVQRQFSAELVGFNDATLDTITIVQVPEGEVDLSTLTINYSGVPTNSRLLDPGPETITLPTGTVFNYKNNLVADGGYNLSNVSFGGIGNVLLVGDESAVWSNDFTLSGSSTLNVAITGTVTSEPNTLIVNVHNNIGSSEISKGTFQFQYDLDEVGETLSTDYNESVRSLTLSSTDTNRSFDATSEIVVQGGNAQLEYSNGVINIVLNPTYPTPDANKNAVIDVVISPASSLPQGQPTSDPATAGFFGTDIVTIPSGGGVFSVAYVANGSVQAVLRNSVSWLASFSAAQATDTTGRIGHSGGIFSTTTRREATLDLYPSDSTSGSPLDTLTIVQGIELDTTATTASLSANGNSTVAHDDPESSFSFTVVSDGAWQIYGGSGSDAVGGGTLHTSPPTGSAGATTVNITFSGGGGTVWQGNNIIVQPLGGGGSIGSLTFHQYRSIVTQADYNSLQSSSAPSNVKNATFYITD